jgi:hypothetical protein
VCANLELASKRELEYGLRQWTEAS